MAMDTTCEVLPCEVSAVSLTHKHDSEPSALTDIAQKCHVLETIPIELRTKILKLALDDGLDVITCGEFDNSDETDDAGDFLEPGQKSRDDSDSDSDDSEDGEKATEAEEEPVRILHPVEPPLLFTCRQIREEAIKLFWTSKPVEINVHGCGIQEMMELEKRCAALGIVDTMKVTVGLVGKLENWDDLEHWCRHVHGGRDWIPEEEGQCPWTDKFILGALPVAKRLRGVDFEEVQKALRDYKGSFECTRVYGTFYAD